MFEDRVEKGAALLDRVRPGWAAEIACDELGMETCTKCILGQIYGDYWVGFKQVLRPLDPRTLYRAGDFGFTLYDFEQNAPATLDQAFARFAGLADAWRAAIRSRLAPAGGGAAP